jgi:hypothetical protein
MAPKIKYHLKPPRNPTPPPCKSSFSPLQKDHFNISLLSSPFYFCNTLLSTLYTWGSLTSLVSQTCQPRSVLRALVLAIPSTQAPLHLSPPEKDPSFSDYPITTSHCHVICFKFLLSIVSLPASCCFSFYYLPN